MLQGQNLTELKKSYDAFATLKSPFNLTKRSISQDKSKVPQFSPFLNPPKGKDFYVSPLQNEYYEIDSPAHYFHSLKPELKQNCEKKCLNSGVYSSKLQTSKSSPKLAEMSKNELLFKIKTKLSNILREIEAPSSDIAQLCSFDESESSLDFALQKIRLKLIHYQKVESQLVRFKERQQASEVMYEEQIQSFSKKIYEKEQNERMYKTKLRESQMEIQVLHEKQNKREREYSQQQTELYQTQVMLRESQKFNLPLQQRIKLLEKQKIETKQACESETKRLKIASLGLQEQYAKAQQKNILFIEELEQAKKKQTLIVEANNHLSEEAAIWKQRYSYLEKEISNAESQRDKEEEAQERERHNLLEEECTGLHRKIQALQFENIRYKDRMMCSEQREKAEKERTERQNELINEQIHQHWNKKMNEVVEKYESEKMELMREGGRVVRDNEALTKNLELLKRQLQCLAKQQTSYLDARNAPRPQKSCQTSISCVQEYKDIFIKSRTDKSDQQSVDVFTRLTRGVSTKTVTKETGVKKP